MNVILQIITSYGMDIVLCAVLTFSLTGIIKMPLKSLAEKSTNSKKYTRFLTFLPVILGFGIVSLYTYFERKMIIFDELFFTRWLSSVSVSLAFYAFWEKFVPSKKKILQEEEIAANKALVQEVEAFLLKKTDQTSEAGDDGQNAKIPLEDSREKQINNESEENKDNLPMSSVSNFQPSVKEKIVLRGGIHASTSEDK